MTLSTKAATLLAFLQERLLGNRAAPSYDEMAEAIRLKTKSNIKRYLEELRAAGEIAYEVGKPRAIVLLQALKPTTRIPVAGSISAGRPIPSLNRLHTDVEYDHDFVTFTADQLPQANHSALVALWVNGDSMIDANVQDGDLIILSTQFTPREGDMLAFELKADNSFTLKHYFEEGDKILLQPANPNYQTLPMDREQVEALGKVVLVQRRFAA